MAWGGECVVDGQIAGWYKGNEGGEELIFLSALKPPRRELDFTHLDHTARQHWVDRHGTVQPRPSAPTLQPSPVGRVVARSIVLF